MWKHIGLALAAFVVAAPCAARTIIVSKSAGDFSTVMAGLSAASPGDTVLVKSGVYGEFVEFPKSGSASGGAVTLKAFGDGAAVIDGSGLAITQAAAQLVSIRGKSYVALIGLEIRNCITGNAGIFNKGIQVEGGAHHITIRKCRIHAIENNATSTTAGANAVGVFGTEPDLPISDLIIDSCEIFDNKTGYSEAVSVDGNVDGFRITRCHVHDNNNIGILIAGSYGECDGCGPSDQARHGVIADNIVERCSSGKNSAYNGDWAADGIYSDGGGKSIIERNIISECDIGIEAGAELARAVDDSMIIRDNLIYNCNTGGMFIGGYETGRGVAVHCTVLNNTFYLNDASNSGSGELLIQKAHDNIVRNNIFYTTSQKTALSIAFSSAYSYNNTIENNLFFSASGGAVGGAELDARAIKKDPLFVNGGTNFRLKEGSPAINACFADFQPAPGELDAGGNPRKAGAAVDIGAYEYGAAAVTKHIREKTPSTATTPRLILTISPLRHPRMHVIGIAGKQVMPSGRMLPLRRARGN